MWLYLTTVLIASVCCVEGTGQGKTEVDKLATARLDIPEPLHVTLSVFSGLPNPEWQILPGTQNYTAIKQLLESARDGGLVYPPEKMPMRLGYRGFLVKGATALKGQKELILDPKTVNLQKMLLQTIPDKVLSKAAKYSVSLEFGKGTLSDNSKTKRAAPAYAPNNWNINPRTKALNNCYNYANNKVTDTFALPGSGAGQPMVDPVRTNNVKAAAIRDGLWELPEEWVPPVIGTVSVEAIPPSRRQNSHLVALFVAEGPVNGPGDFHWYRLDDNGYWSHKIADEDVTDRDDLGNRMRDPRAAAIPNFPPYQFVCFMTTNPAQVKID